MRRMRMAVLATMIGTLVLAAACGSGTPAGDNTNSTTTPAPLAAPTNVTIQAGDAQATLSWDAVAGATSYTIFWNTTGSVTAVDTAIADATTPYTHTGLTNGMTSYYAVAAVNAAGLGDLSQEVSATPQAIGPGAPANVAATAGYEQVTVTWDAVAGAVSYNLYWSTTSGVTPESGTKIAGVTSPYTHTALTGGQAYYYIVTAVDADAEGTASSQVSATADYPQRRAFITSVTGSGDLSSWADAIAAGKTGLAAGDAVCAARATAAGLAGTYVAWLSDETDDAYCRVHGGTGKKGACAGTTTTIGQAGPWVRRDGLPFAARIDQALAPTYRVLHPILLDETGTPHPAGYYFTNTDEDGENASASVSKPCNNWQSGNVGDTFMGGYYQATGSQWSEGFGGLCNMNSSLLCLQTGPGGALPASNGSGKRVFVTSVGGNGKFGSWADAGGKTGLNAADAICAARATAAGVSGSYKAYLSTSAVDAKDRLASDGPWVRVDGVTIAASKADLTDGDLLAPINVTEEGAYLSGDMYAATGSWSGGTKEGHYCVDWTDETSTGAFGDIVMIDSNWSRYSVLNCELPGIAYHLYCFED